MPSQDGLETGQNPESSSPASTTSPEKAKKPRRNKVSHPARVTLADAASITFVLVGSTEHSEEFKESITKMSAKG